MCYNKFMVYLLIIIYLIMVLVFSARPLKSSMSQFELERRAKAGNKPAQDILAREQLLPDVAVLKNLKLALLTILFVWLIYAAYGFLLAVLITGLVWLSLEPVSKVSFIKRLANKLYQKTEPTILKYIVKVAPVFKFFHAAISDFAPKVGSKEELANIIANAEPAVVSIGERTALLELIDSNDKLIKDIMAPKDKIEAVKADELLGPLVLDKLHATTFSRFPVIDKGLNHVVGVLNIEHLLELDSKKSVKAEKTMNETVYFLNEDYSLVRALAAALEHKADFFIVVDSEHKTTGLITLRDIINGILGKELFSLAEDDSNDIIESVKTKTYNNPPGGVDV